MKENLKAIIIAESKNNSSQYLKTIEKAGYEISSTLIKTKQKFKQALNENIWDIIICDHRLPKFNALSALEILHELELKIPFIVISSKKDNKILIDLIKKGASNFILKKNLNELPGIIKDEISAVKLRAKESTGITQIHQISQGHYLTLFENSPTPLWEEDFSELDKYLEKLKAKGIKNFKNYFDNKPVELKKCFSKIKILAVNEATLKLFKADSKDELIKNLDKIFTENSYNIFKEELIAVSKGKRDFECETEIKTLTGEKIFILLQLKINKHEKGLERALLATINISDRKITEESLKLYTTRLEQAEKDAKLGSWEFDVVNQKGWWSKQMFLMFGFDESKGIPPYDDYLEHFHKGDRDLLLFALKSMEQGEIPIPVIFRSNPDLGAIRYFEPTFKIARNSDGKILKYTGTLHDITIRKMNESILQHLNRELRAISNCNQTLLRVDDEQTLLNEICRIICDEADYLFAWVGYAINDEYKTVKPMAVAGLEEGYLEAAKLSWSDETEYGRGPVGKAIRTGEIIYSQNFSIDDNMKTWRKAALQRGYNSIIVFPLKDEKKKTFGVLAVYSSEINIITPNEIRLMEELANDLAFGISNLRLRDERKKAEEALRESEGRFKELANLLPQTIFETDIEGKLTYANETALTSYVYTHEDVEKGIYIINTVSEKDREIARKEIQGVLKGIPARRNEYEMLRKDGTTFQALSFVGPIFREGKIIGLRGTTVDITKNKETENELRKLSEAVAQSPASIIITDVNGNIEYVNKTFEEISGYTFNEAVKENPRILKSGQMPKEKYKELWETISSGKTWHGEFLNKKKYGELYWEDAIISPIKDKKGIVTNYLGIKQDITEKKKMLQELIEAKEKAEEMNRVKTIFFANMSHELRTPFVGIMGFAELLTETLTDPEIKEMAEGILRTSIRMKDTLTQILNLSKLEINEIQTFPKQINVHKLIDDIYKQFSAAAVKKNLTFNTYVKVEEPAIQTDETLLIEILNNLVSNAIIYTDEGSLNLTAENQVKNGKKVLIIKVIDTGIGISPEKHDLVWQEFRQASEGTTRRYQGTGLGLSISKKYSELLGGSIYLESEEGRGSTFILELPIVKNNKSALPPEEKLPVVIKDTDNKESSQKNILYVEDDDTSIAVVTIALSKRYKIEVAKNADDALSKIKEMTFDAILMDINLGRGMNGEELTQVIRKIPGCENIPIVAVTAYASEEDKNEFLSKGMSHYISKPFLIQDLVKLIVSVFK